jgi:hypothetical protein
VHLAGEADATDFSCANIGVGQRLADRDGAGAPPVLGMLLRPADLWRGERCVLFGRGCEQAALFVDDEGPRAASANVNAE